VQMGSLQLSNVICECLTQKLRGGGCMLIMKETLWKNNRNLVKDVPM